MSNADVALLSDLGIEYEETKDRRWRVAGHVSPAPTSACVVTVHRDDNDAPLGSARPDANGNYEIIIEYGGPVYSRGIDDERIGRSSVALPEEME